LGGAPRASAQLQTWEAAGHGAGPVHLKIMVPQTKLNEGKFPIEIKDFSHASHKSNDKKSTL
jgi:hypothetical protein